MGIYSDRYTPTIIRNIDNPSVGFTFRTADDYASIKFENNYFKFYIGETLALEFDEDGLDISGIISSRRGVESITAVGSPNSINFSSALESTDYVLTLRCYDGSGNNVDYQINNKYTIGFDITAPIDATVEYFAIEI